MCAACGILGPQPGIEHMSPALRVTSLKPLDHGGSLIICFIYGSVYAGQEATVRTGHGTTDWFQIEKGVRQGCILSLCYLTYMQSTS